MLKFKEIGVIFIKLSVAEDWPWNLPKNCRESGAANYFENGNNSFLSFRIFYVFFLIKNSEKCEQLVETIQYPEGPPEVAPFPGIE